MKSRLDIHFLDREKTRWTASERTRISRTLRDAFAQARETLALPAIVNVTLFADAKECVPETGEGGYTADADWIQLSLSPAKRRRWPAIIGGALTSTFFHELHHASRQYKLGERTTLADDVLTEGLATVFSMEQFPDFIPPWSKATDVQAKKWLRMMKKDWNKTQYARWPYFFKPGPDRWAGYRLGTWLVRRAQETTGLTAGELVAMRAQTLLKAAGN